MRALVFHGPGDIRVEKRPDPVPASDEVLLRIVATGICGSDVHGYTGESGRRHPGQIMGHETVGRIVAVGGAVPTEWGLAPGRVTTVNPVIGCGSCKECAAGVEQLCASRRIIGVEPSLDSAFAELMVAPARNVVVLADSVPEEHGALVEPLAVAYHAAVRGEVGPQDRVFVVGGGPIGQACALAARRLGASDVVVTEPSRARRALVQRLGFVTIDPGTDRVADEVRGGLGQPASVVLDAVGTSATLADAFAASALGARVVLVGMNSPKITVDAYAISTYERSVIGSFTYPSRAFRATAEWVATQPAGLEHMVDDRVALAAAPAAFDRLASGQLDASKILVLPQERGERVGRP
jgi:threonine dehydrogenase-like Zn-dependent dehydrogenase